MMPGTTPTIVRNTLPLICTNPANAFSTAIAASVNFTGQSIDVEPAAGQRRFVFVAVGNYAGSGSNSVASVSVLGDAATQIDSNIHAVTGYALVSLWMVEKPAGTSGTINITLSSGSPNNRGFSVFSVYSDMNGVSVGTAVKDTGRPIDLSASVAKGGVGIAAVMNRNGGLHTWTGLTERYDVDFLSDDCFSTAMNTFGSAVTGLAVQANSASAGNEHAGIFIPVAPL